MTRLKVAILPWGDVIEDFLDTIEVSLEDFATEMTGGWLFGYVEALETANVGSVLVCFSSGIASPRLFHNRPTGATVRVLPASGGLRWFRGFRGARVGVGSYLATPLRRLAWSLKEDACDVLLCQEYEYPRFDAVVLLGRTIGIPVFATFQGGNWQNTILERPLRPWALRGSSGLVIGPEEELHRVRDRYRVPLEKIARIFNPVDVSRWHRRDRVDARRSLNIAPDEKVIAWHGRIDIRRKGLDVLLDAWSKLSRSDATPRRRLLLIGWGQDAPRFRALVTSRQNDNVTWIDRYITDREELRRHLSAADLYVLPSRHEGFPVALVEAMSAGLPVVASGAPGVKDILAGGEDSGGVVVPVEDAAALGDAMERVLASDDLASTLAKRARGRAEMAFSPDAVGAHLREFFVRRGAAWKASSGAHGGAT